MGSYIQYRKMSTPTKKVGQGVVLFEFERKTKEEVQEEKEQAFLDDLMKKRELRIEEEERQKAKKAKEDEIRRKAEEIERVRLEKIKMIELAKTQAMTPELERLKFEKNSAIKKVKWNSTGWKEYENMNKVDQGGAEIIYNWRKFYSILDLQEMVEQNGYSAITIYPDFEHAVLRKFDYQLTVDHCEPAEGYTCSTFIFPPPKQQAITIEQVEPID